MPSKLLFWHHIVKYACCCLFVFTTAESLRAAPLNAGCRTVALSDHKSY